MYRLIITAYGVRWEHDFHRESLEEAVAWVQEVIGRMNFSVRHTARLQGYDATKPIGKRTFDIGPLDTRAAGKPF